MPYINGDTRRADLAIEFETPENVGELNFVLTTIVLKYLKEQKLSYTSLNGVMGVLDCMKFELFGRLLSHLETMKLVQNGDLEGFKEFEAILREQWLEIQTAQMEADDAKVQAKDMQQESVDYTDAMAEEDARAALTVVDTRKD